MARPPLPPLTTLQPLTATSAVRSADAQRLHARHLGRATGPDDTRDDASPVVMAQFAGVAQPGGAVIGWVATRPEALVELTIEQLRDWARREGCVPEEVEEARNTERPRATLEALILRTSAWRATELARQLAALDQMALVGLATRPSISRVALEAARDSERPMQALVRLLLSAPDFVVEQRTAHLHSQLTAPHATLWTYIGAVGAGAVGGAMIVGVTIGAPGENLLPAPCDLPAARGDLLIC